MHRYYKFSLFLIINNLLAIYHPCSQYGLWPHHYQDIFINGQTVCSLGGGQQCSPRYEAIKNIVDLYKRPVTVLDLGAAEGYMTFRLAHDFPESTFVMLEGNSQDLLKLCELNNKKNVIYLNKFMSVAELKLLADCEHFDIIICLNVLHHFKQNWKPALDNLLQLGEKIIIEVPPPHSATVYDEEINKTLSNICSKIICKVPRWSNTNLEANTYLIERKKEFLFSTFYGNYYTNPVHKRTYKIISDYTQKYLAKYAGSGELVSKTVYYPGINFMTFKELNGIFPNKKVLISALEQLIGVQHNECAPYNLVIQGGKIIPIDTQDREQYGTCLHGMITSIIANLKKFGLLEVLG